MFLYMSAVCVSLREDCFLVVVVVVFFFGGGLRKIDWPIGHMHTHTSTLYELFHVILGYFRV